MPAQQVKLFILFDASTFVDIKGVGSMDIHDVVKERYGLIASGEAQSCCGSGSDCGCNTMLYDASLIEGLPVDVTGLSLG
jgi:hypothetical protein